MRARLLAGPADGLEVDLGTGEPPATIRVAVYDREVHIARKPTDTPAPGEVLDVYALEPADHRDTWAVYTWAPTTPVS